MIKDENFYQINGWMLNVLNLKGIALNVYAIIYGFSQDGESEFKGSRKYLCEFTGATKPTIDKALDDLINQGFIIKKTEILNNIKFNKYRANLDAIKNFTSGKETLPGSKEILPGGGKETLPNNIDYKQNNNKNIICAVANEILDYLNEKAGTRFRPVDSNLKYINARLKDYAADDLKRVIDLKVKDWKGTQWQQYLRPETLFNATKFETYANGLKEIKENKPQEFIHNNYTDEQKSEFYADLEKVEL